METPVHTSDKEPLAEVARLREQFPHTQDLYREVCALMFFRYGITPTANKLYQLVRKGSMSAPAEALNSFWERLRERSRVTVEHADLPDELKSAAGELVAALWKTAQTASKASLAALRDDAAAAVTAAKVVEADAMARITETVEALERTQELLVTSQQLAGQLRLELAAAAATNAALEERLAEARSDLASAHQRQDETRQANAADLEKLGARTKPAEERFEAMEKRALLEIDRERTTTAKLQKTLEAERTANAVAIDRMRADYNGAQSNLGHLREQLGTLQHAVATLTDQRDIALAQLQATRSELIASIRQAAIEGARAGHLRDELNRVCAEPGPRVTAAALGADREQARANKPRRKTATAKTPEG
jgi:chromosome segregation ATPase